MGSYRKSSLFLLVATAALCLGVAASAWACVPASYLWAEPAYGPAGSEVAVNGKQFDGGSVELRWGSETGPVLGMAHSGDFTQNLEVPETAADGVYMVLALTRAEDGSIREWNRTPFEVTSSGAPSSWGDGGWSQRPDPAFQPSPSPAGSAVPLPSGDAAPSPGRTAVPAPAGSEVASPDLGAEPSLGTNGVPTPDPEAGPVAKLVPVGELAPAPWTVSRPDPQRAGAPGRQAPTGKARSPQGEQRTFGGSALPTRVPAFAGTAPRETPRAVGDNATPDATSTDGQSPSQGSATADVWSGFEGGRSSLTPSATPRSEGSRSRAAVGVGLLGLGLVSLVAGAGGVGLRRRRSHAR